MDDSAIQPILSSPSDVSPVGGAADAFNAPSSDARSDLQTASAKSTPSADKKSPRPTAPMIVFAYDCLRREFEALVAHQPASNAAPEPGEVHQMRIATRRLRVALRLFRRMLPSEAKQFRQSFSRFARALGEVRDLDVYGDNFRTYAQAVPAEKLGELGGYELHLRRERGDARSNLTSTFADERHAELLRSFAEFLQGAPTPAAVRRWQSFKVADGVDKYLKKSLKRVHKLGRKVGSEARAKDLHRLRIRTKRFRYELEFFVAVYPSLAKTAKATKVLQDLLGVHQDARTATDRLKAYARSLRKNGRAALPAALGALVASQEQQARDVRAKFGGEWRTFELAVARGKLAS